MDRKRIAIACQGGGSQCAFVAGALDTLFENQIHHRYELVGLSGTSGGALTAAMAWFGLLKEAAGDRTPISERVLARIQPEATAPALLSVVPLPRWDPARVLTGSARLVLVADGIEYAGNLGTLVRTADACAVDALVLTRATARVTHPKVFAASRGMVLTTPVLTYRTVAEARADLAGTGFTTYVADPAGATPYRSAGLGAGRTAVVVGSEGDGVSDEWREGLTRVAIPMRGRADSLNVAASAAVLLFEARATLDEG